MDSVRDSVQHWLTVAVSTRLALRPVLLPTQILSVLLRPASRGAAFSLASAHRQ